MKVHLELPTPGARGVGTQRSWELKQAYGACGPTSSHQVRVRTASLGGLTSGQRGCQLLPTGCLCKGNPQRAVGVWTMRGRWTWHLKIYSTHTRVPQQLLPPPSTPPRMQGQVLPTQRLSQAEGGVQQVQGGVDCGLGQALNGSLVTGAQQALTRVPGLCAWSKGRASWKRSLGIPRGNANSEAELPLCPAHTPCLPWSPHLMYLLHLFRGWVGPVCTPTPFCSHTHTHMTH